MMIESERRATGIAYMRGLLPNAGIIVTTDGDIIAELISNLVGDMYVDHSMARDAEGSFDVLMRRGLVFAVNFEGQLSIYSTSNIAHMTPEARSRISELVKGKQNPKVAWYTSLHAAPTIIPMASIIPKQRAPVVKPLRMKQEPATPAEKDDIRRKFWAPGGFAPSTAGKVVDRLLK